MQFLIFAFLVSFAYADPGLLGTKECTYGPSYWCSHALNAKQCGAVQHCIDTVWTKQIIKPKDTTECNFCKIGIAEAKAMLKKNGTEEKIKEYMGEICKLLSDTSMKAKCTKFVTQDLPLLMSLLKSDMTPEQICATIKLCTGFEDKVEHSVVPEQEKPVQKNNKVCKDCINFFTDVENMIVSNDTTTQIEQMLKQTICSQLSSLKETCDFVVDEFVPQLLQYLGKTVDPKTTCRIIGFCNNGDLFTALRIRMQNKQLFRMFNKKVIGGQEECDVCKNVMTEVQNLDRDATVQDKIKGVVKTELCTRLGSLGKECDDLVDQYAPLLFQLLANELDPETVCSFIGFCRAVSVPKTSGISVVHLTKTDSLKALSLLPSMPIKEDKPVKTSGVFCDVCKLAMTELDTMLAKNATKAQIEQALDQVCDRLPGALKDQCKSFIGQYAAAILELLEQELNPTVVCDKLGLCTPLKANNNLKTSPQCVLCEFVMSEIESLLANNKSKAAIESAFDRICNLMPATIKTECTQFVSQYSQLIISLLLKEVKPAAVCKAIDLCTGSVTAAIKPVVQKQPIKSLPLPVSGILLRGEPVVNNNKPLKVTDEKCLVCETLLNYLAEALKENKTEAYLKALLNKACSLLPKSMADECEGLVIAFGDTILKELMKEIDPKQICTDIGFCPASINKNEFLKKPMKFMKEEFKNLINDGMKFVDNRLLFKPRNNNLGKKKCGYGPSYWCKNMDTAKECDMMEHCKTVWSKK